MLHMVSKSNNSSSFIFNKGLLDMCIGEFLFSNITKHEFIWIYLFLFLGEIRKLKFESHDVYGNLIAEVLLLEINGSKEDTKTDL